MIRNDLPTFLVSVSLISLRPWRHGVLATKFGHTSAPCVPNVAERRYDSFVFGAPWSSSTVSAIAIAFFARATMASSALIFWYARRTCSW
jgi:hypothetical protein